MSSHSFREKLAMLEEARLSVSWRNRVAFFRLERLRHLATFAVLLGESDWIVSEASVLSDGRHRLYMLLTLSSYTVCSLQVTQVKITWWCTFWSDSSISQLLNDNILLQQSYSNLPCRDRVPSWIDSKLNWWVCEKPVFATTVRLYVGNVCF